MMGTAHAASGLLLATATRPIADTIGADPALWYAAWVGGCMLPDLDTSGSHGARVWGPPTRVLGGIVSDLAGGHRGETHNACRAPLVVTAAGLAAVTLLKPAADYLRPIVEDAFGPALASARRSLEGTAQDLTLNGPPGVGDAVHSLAQHIPQTNPAGPDLTLTGWLLAAVSTIPVLAVALIIGIALRMIPWKAATPLRNPASNFVTSIAITYAAASTGYLWWAPIVVAAGMLTHMAGDGVTEEGLPRPTLIGPIPKGRIGLQLFKTDSIPGHACTPLFLLLTGALLYRPDIAPKILTGAAILGGAILATAITTRTQTIHKRSRQEPGEEHREDHRDTRRDQPTVARPPRITHERHPQADHIHDPRETHAR